MSDFLNYDFITQAIGILASGFVVFSFSQKRDNHLKGYLILGNILFVIHFALLGAFAGMLVATANGFRNGFSIKLHKSTKTMLLFWAIYIAIGFAIYENIYDLLPVCSGLLGTFAMFKLSGIKMRLMGMIGSSAWLIYGIIFHSIGGIITESSVITLNLITIFRLTRDKQK